MFDRLMIKLLLLVALACVQAGSIVAQEHELRELEKKDLIKKKYWPSRLGDKEERRCESCEEREAKKRMEYLSRVLASSYSEEFHSQVRNRVLEDTKFAKGCWKRLSPKDVEVFFTVNAQGQAEDLATFPRKVLTNCLKRRIKKVEYPAPDQPTHVWLLVSNSEQNL